MLISPALKRSTCWDTHGALILIGKYSSVLNTRGGGLINFCDYSETPPPSYCDFEKFRIFFLKLKRPYLFNQSTFIHIFSTKLLNSTSSTKQICYLSLINLKILKICPPPPYIRITRGPPLINFSGHPETPPPCIRHARVV